MKDVHYLEACKSGFKLNVSHFRKDCVRRVAQVYESNMNLVWNLLGFPPLVSIISSWYRQAAIEIDDEIKTGKVKLPISNRDTSDPINKKFLNDLVEKRTDKMLEWLKDHPSEDRHEYRTGFNNFNYFIQLFIGSHIEDGVRAILESAIKNSWTAFEVLCQDLISEAARDFPTCFHHINFQDVDFGFKSRARIRHAYRTTFKSNYDLVSKAMNDDSMDALALLRNVLVHKSGLADDEFLDGAKFIPLLNPFHGHTEGQRVEIDGNIIKSVVGASSRMAVELMIGVDTWITLAHPTWQTTCNLKQNAEPATGAVATRTLKRMAVGLYATIAMALATFLRRLAQKFWNWSATIQRLK